MSNQKVKIIAIWQNAISKLIQFHNFEDISYTFYISITVRLLWFLWFGEGNKYIECMREDLQDLRERVININNIFGMHQQNLRDSSPKFYYFVQPTSSSESDNILIWLHSFSYRERIQESRWQDTIKFIFSPTLIVFFRMENLSSNLKNLVDIFSESQWYVA